MMPNSIRQHVTGDGNIFSGSGDVKLTTYNIHLPDKEGKARPRLAYEPDLVEVAAGSFLMGSSPAAGVPVYETPQHQVILPGYLIGKTPVTNAQYEVFIRSTGYEAPKFWVLRKPPEDRLDHPVTGVSWDDAVAWCAWLSEQSGRPYRLPSEAEWEKAARSVDGWLYPWGNGWQDSCCNCGSTSTTPVTAFPAGASPYGCLDLLGNAREWTSTIWGSNPGQADFYYPWQMDGRNDLEPGSAPVFRIHRGGCFRDQPQDLRCSARSFSAANSRVNQLGFRAALDIQ